MRTIVLNVSSVTGSAGYPVRIFTNAIRLTSVPYLSPPTSCLLSETNPEPVWQTCIVESSEHGQRLDSFLVKHFGGFSRVKLQRAIADGSVLVDNKKAKSSLRLKADQTVRFRPPERTPETPIPEAISLDILYEDEHFVAINKPPNMVVHPAKGHWAGTLTSALAYHFETLSTIGGPTRPGIVHRLDRDTSGVILVARTDHAHSALSSQFEARTVNKEYLTIVTPAPDRDRDQIDKPIGNHPYQREKKAIRENHTSSRNAVSFYEVIDRYQGFATVLVKPKTGRTHQIRIHMAHVGCPVLCDKLYSGRASVTLKDFSKAPADTTVILNRQALHARSIEFDHPVSKERMTIEAPLPDDIQATIAALKQHRS